MVTTDTLTIPQLGRVPVSLWKQTEVQAMRYLSQLEAPVDNNEKQKLLWDMTRLLLGYKKHN